MARNNRNQIAIYRDVSAVVAVALSPQENGVRVRQVQGPTTTVSLPSDAFPNDGDSYEITEEPPPVPDPEPPPAVDARP